MFLNLCRPVPIKAREATAHEKAELGPKVVAYKGYGGYQRRTDRPITLGALTPA